MHRIKCQKKPNKMVDIKVEYTESDDIMFRINWKILEV